jgi:hypothetical protein
MRVLSVRVMSMLLLGGVLVGTDLGAQAPANDPSARLREVLPPDVAERVLARIAGARSRELPPQAVTALENRALKFASRGVAPADVERAVGEHADRMLRSREAIETARAAKASGEEIDAGAEAMRQGVDGASVSALAKSAPSGRSLAVPLFVVGQLVERGLPSDAALARVRERLMARATDRDLERMPGEQGRRPATAGQGRPADRPGATGRPQQGPATGGQGTIPTAPGRGRRP